MRVTCVGGGPSGLYFAALTKLRVPEAHVSVIERNPEGSTYGLGLVFVEELRTQMHANDPVSARAVDDAAVQYVAQAVDIAGTIENDAHLGTSMGYSIRRQTLLDLLAHRARELGVEIEYGREITDLAELDEADLIVASDGVHSPIRSLDIEHFGVQSEIGPNKYIWLGTSKVFDSFTFPFVSTEFGWIWAHAYNIGGGLSTFIVECTDETWTGLGFDRMEPDETLSVLSSLFAGPLEDEPVVGQSLDPDSIQWLNFRRLTNEHWFHDKVVLVGDAAHTTHFTIGSGTTLAIEDAIVLNESLDAAGWPADPERLASGLSVYEARRKDEIQEAQRDAEFSAQWFENVPRYIDLASRQFFVLLKSRRAPGLARVDPLKYYRALERMKDGSTL